MSLQTMITEVFSCSFNETSHYIFIKLGWNQKSYEIESNKSWPYWIIQWNMSFLMVLQWNNSYYMYKMRLESEVIQNWIKQVMVLLNHKTKQVLFSWSISGAKSDWSIVRTCVLRSDQTKAWELELHQTKTYSYTGSNQWKDIEDDVYREMEIRTEHRRAPVITRK